MSSFSYRGPSTLYSRISNMGGTGCPGLNFAGTHTSGGGRGGCGRVSGILSTRGGIGGCVG